MPSHKMQQGVTWKDVLNAFAILLFLSVAYAVMTPWVCSKGYRKNARRASCQSNMKQLGLAYTQYTLDSDGEFPRGYTLGGEGWAGKIYPFVKATSFYQCPDDKQDGKYISYAENERLARRKITDLTDMAQTLELYEDTTLDCDPMTAETVSETGLAPPQDSKRHDETDFRLNYLFVDGHVRWLKPGAVSSGLKPVRPKQIAEPGTGQFMATFAVK